jgi:ABC-2 type transport system permease protein
MILAMALGAAATAGEFRHGTATVTYLAVPARARVLAAKCCAALPAGALFGAAAPAANTAVGLAFAAAHGYHLAVPAVTIIRYAAGDAAGCTLLAALGAAAGTLIRSQVAAVITVFAWAFLIEGALGALPFTAAAAVTAGAAFLLAAAAARVTLPRDIT